MTTTDPTTLDTHPARRSCTTTGQSVPATRFCIACGEQFDDIDLTKIFTASQRVAGYAELLPEDRASEQATQLENGEPEATPTSTESGDEAATANDAPDENDSPGLLERIRARFSRHDAQPSAADVDAAELDLEQVMGPLPETDADTTDDDSEEESDGARRRSRLAPAVLCGTALVLVGAVGFGTVLALRGGQEQAETTQTVVSLPGWSSTAAWSAGQPSGRVGVSRDGRLVGSAQGRTVSVRQADSGKELTTTKLDGDPVGGVFPATISGRPALLAFTTSTLTVWSGPDATTSTTPLPKGARMQLHAGVPFVVAGDDVSEITAAGPLPVVSPRAGAAVLGTAGDGAVSWASARGDIITAAVNGTAVSVAPLERPKDAKKLAGWVTATQHAAWVRWTLNDGSSVLVAHDIATGKAVSTVPADASAAEAVSQSGQRLVVDGVLFNATGKRVPLPADFVAGTFVGETPYGATSSGKPALTNGREIQTIPAPSVVPVATTADRGLVALENGHLSMYPSRTHEGSTAP